MSSGDEHDGSRRTLRVVYVGHVAQLSGGEIALLRLLPHLRRVDAHVILAEDGPFVERLRAAGISVEVLPMAARARNVRKEAVRPGRVPVGAVLTTAGYVVRLARRLRELRPDVVHTNTLKAGLYGSLAGRLARVPVVWHVRDRIADDYLPASAAWAVRRALRWLPARVIANSNATLRTLQPSRRSVGSYSVAPSVVPEVAADLPAGRRETTADEVRFGIVGRLAPWKGQDLFLRAFAAAFPDPAGRERAIVIGAALFGEDDYAASLPALAQELGIADRVSLLGFRDDVWAELRRLDVVVNASRSAEPFGQVVLEAMVAGLPTIVPNEGGPAEIVVDGRTGLHVPPNDPNALAAAMWRLRDDRGLRERLGRAGCEEARRYRAEVVAEQVQTLYDDLVRPRRRRSARPGQTARERTGT